MAISWKDVGISLGLVAILLASYAISFKGQIGEPGFVFVLVATGIALFLYFKKNKSGVKEAALVSILSGLLSLGAYVFLINPIYLTCFIYLGDGHYGGLMCDPSTHYIREAFFLAVILVEGLVLRFSVQMLEKMKK